MLSWGNETLKISSSPPPLSRPSSVIDTQYMPLPHSSSCRYCLRFKWRYHKYLSMQVRSRSQFVSLYIVTRKYCANFNWCFQNHGQLLLGTPVFRVWPLGICFALVPPPFRSGELSPRYLVCGPYEDQDILGCDLVFFSRYVSTQTFGNTFFFHLQGFCLPTYTMSHPKRLFVILNRKTWILFKNSARTAQ